MKTLLFGADFSPLLRRRQVPLLIPCHRVISSSGQSGPYMGGRGDHLKQWLLTHERQRGADWSMTEAECPSFARTHTHALPHIHTHTRSRAAPGFLWKQYIKKKKKRSHKVWNVTHPVEQLEILVDIQQILFFFFKSKNRDAASLMRYRVVAELECTKIT